MLPESGFSAFSGKAQTKSTCSQTREKTVGSGSSVAALQHLQTAYHHSPHLQTAPILEAIKFSFVYMAELSLGQELQQ